MRKYRVVVVSLWLFVTGAIGLQAAESLPAPPSFWLSNLERDRFDSRTQAEPYLVSFFFVGCVPCLEEIPTLYRLREQHFPNTPLLFISPLREDTLERIGRFADQLQVPRSFFYADRFGQVARKFFPDQQKLRFPALFLLDSQQVLLRSYVLDEATQTRLMGKLRSKY